MTNSGLWVRTQDKECLVFCTSFALGNKLIGREEPIVIRGFDSDGDEWILGEYDNFNQGKRILNRIQEKIRMGWPTFDMPEKSFDF